MTQQSAVPEHVFKAAERVLKFQFLWQLNRALANSGLSPDTCAARLGWPRYRFLRIMRGRGEITLRDIADVGFSIGVEIEFDVTQKATP